MNKKYNVPALYELLFRWREMIHNDQTIISHSCRFDEENTMGDKIVTRGQSILSKAIPGLLSHGYREIKCVWFQDAKFVLTCYSIIQNEYTSASI